MFTFVCNGAEDSQPAKRVCGSESPTDRHAAARMGSRGDKYDSLYQLTPEIKFLFSTHCAGLSVEEGCDGG
jgi:hypothetical protein